MPPLFGEIRVLDEAGYQIWFASAAAHGNYLHTMLDSIGVLECVVCLIVAACLIVAVCLIAV